MTVFLFIHHEHSTQPDVIEVYADRETALRAATTVVDGWVKDGAEPYDPGRGGEPDVLLLKYSGDDCSDWVEVRRAEVKS